MPIRQLHSRFGRSKNGGKNYPSILDDGNTILWLDYKDNVTSDESGLVSEWGDKSGNGNNVAQDVTLDKPTLDHQGITFDGSRTRFNRKQIAAMNQPLTIYAVVKLQEFLSLRYFFDGYDTDTCFWATMSTAPITRAFGGSYSANNTNITIGNWYAVKIVFNGASSKYQIGDTTAVTGNFGSSNMGGITLGCRGGASPLAFQHYTLRAFIVRKGADSEDNQAAIYNYLYDKHVRGFDKAKFVLTLDDGADEWYTLAWPLFKSKGIKTTMFLVGNYMILGDKITWAQAVEMEAEGQDVQGHSYTHASFTTLTPAEMNQEWTNNTNAFVTNGLAAPIHFAWPQGGVNALTKSTLREAGVRLTARAVNRGTPDTGLFDTDVDKFEIPSKVFTGTIADLSTYTDAMDIAISQNLAYCLYSHYFVETDVEVLDANYATMELLEAVIDYAIANDMDIITTTQLYELLDEASSGNVLTDPQGNTITDPQGNDIIMPS